MKKRPLRSPGLSDEAYWRWLGANAFRGNIDIDEYEGPISAQQRDWFYAGKKKEQELNDFWDEGSDEHALLGETPTHVIPDEVDQPLKVVPLHESNYRDIVATLRLIADQIENDEYGNVNDCVLALQGSTLSVFHTGAGGAETAHLLLACAQRKLELAVINHYE